MKFKYVITGNDCKAKVFHSNLNLNEMVSLINELCKKVHPNLPDLVLKIGIYEFINPKVMTIDDFANFNPYIFWGVICSE